MRSDCGGGTFSGWTAYGTFTTIIAPCVAPISQASAFVSGAITQTTIPGSFTGNANGFLVIQSTSPTPPTQPVNGTLYNAGNIATLGAGLTFIQSSASTNFTGSGLTANTQYYYYIFAYNNGGCTGGPAYNLAGPLVGTAVTCPAIPNTVATASIVFNGFTLNWTAPTGGALVPLTYTVQVTTDSGYSLHVGGSPFTVLSPITTLTVTGLSSNTLYYYRILASNGCSSAYVTGNVTTLFPLCVAPSSQASSFVLGTVTSTSVPATFSGTASGYLVVRSLTSTPPSQPVNGTTYNAGNVATLGAAFTFVQSGASTAIVGTGLASSTQYHYFIYAYNNSACSGGPAYYLSSPLTGTGTTLAGFNDDCSTAIPLTVGVNCIMSAYSNALATTSSTVGTPAPGCGLYSGGDVWFSAVVPANGILIIDSQAGTILDSGMALYSGSCGALTIIECDDDDSTNGAMSYINRTGLTPGSTVYIRFWEFGNDNNGTFGICASTVSSCQPPFLSDTTNITFTTATINWGPPVVLPTSGYEYVVSTSNTTPAASGIATGALTVNITGLVANTTYYIFVRSNCGGNL
ncbi:MAG: fibronectin type III domain-containing protein [Flavobacterium sp.]|nr:fibronectin type III domain-containing protein [Flavobacterium sp.]